MGKLTVKPVKSPSNQGKTNTKTQQKGINVTLLDPISKKYLCQKMCFSKKIGGVARLRRTAKDGAARYTQDAVYYMIRFDWFAFHGQWPWVPEVSYNSKLEPYLNTKDPVYPNEPHWEWIERRGRPPKGSMRPDVVILDPLSDFMPTTNNIIRVVEMKFEDKEGRGQLDKYVRLVNNDRDRITLLTVNDCDCDDDKEKKKKDKNDKGGDGGKTAREQSAEEAARDMSQVPSHTPVPVGVPAPTPTPVPVPAPTRPNQPNDSPVIVDNAPVYTPAPSRMVRFVVEFNVAEAQRIQKLMNQYMVADEKALAAKEAFEAQQRKMAAQRAAAAAKAKALRQQIANAKSAAEAARFQSVLNDLSTTFQNSMLPKGVPANAVMVPTKDNEYHWVVPLLEGAAIVGLTVLAVGSGVGAAVVLTRFAIIGARLAIRYSPQILATLGLTGVASTSMASDYTPHGGD